MTPRSRTESSLVSLGRAGGGVGSSVDAVGHVGVGPGEEEARGTGGRSANYWEVLADHGEGLEAGAGEVVLGDVTGPHVVAHLDYYGKRFGDNRRFQYTATALRRSYREGPL